MKPNFQWKKLGRVFDPKKFGGWFDEFAQAPCTLIFEDYVRVYFSCRPRSDSGQYVSYSTFLDLERKNLKNVLRVHEKPILSLGEPGTFDEFGTYPVSVIRTDRSVRAYYAGWTRCESVPFTTAIGMAESTDEGTTFKKVGNGPIIPYSLNEPFVMSGPKIRRFDSKWYLYYIAGRKWVMDGGKPEPVYKIRLAISDDGFNWNKVDKDLVESRVEENEAQASPDVFHANGKYHMFFCYRHSKGYRSKEKGYRIGYASSEDAIHWTRNDELAGIDVSESGWDSEMVSYPHVSQIDGVTYLFYLGNDVGKAGFGIAELEGSL